MKASSKWTKWQIGLVSAMIFVYLFQEVKESPEFLAAVRAASNAKLNSTALATQQKQPQSQIQKPSQGQSSPQAQVPSQGKSSVQGQTPSQGQSQTQTQTKPHTRSRAS